MSSLRAAFIAAATGLLVFVLAVWPGGVPLPWSAALALPIAAVTLVGGLFSGGAEPWWRSAPDESGTPTDMQASTLASRLAEASRDPHRFATRIQPRLRRIALASLHARRDTRDVSDVDDPRARAVLGDELHHLLTSPRAVPPPPQEFTALVLRLEALGDGLDRSSEPRGPVNT